MLGSMRKFPVSVHTDNIQPESVGRLVGRFGRLVGVAEGLVTFCSFLGGGPQAKSCSLSTETTDPTMHCRSNSRENTDLRRFHDD